MKYEKLSGMASDTLEKATGKGWDEWVKLLNNKKATEMPHKDIARWISEEMGVDGWWAQTITVGYEQAIGRREPGQRCDGDYETAVSKTFPGSMDDALRIWVKRVKDMDEFNKVKVVGAPEVSKTEKWRYWRASLDNGNKVNVNIYEKSPDKSAFSLQHSGLNSQDEIEEWKEYWKEILSEL